jgi:hypothetical protein
MLSKPFLDSLLLHQSPSTMYVCTFPIPFRLAQQLCSPACWIMPNTTYTVLHRRQDASITHLHFMSVRDGWTLGGGGTKLLGRSPSKNLG